ncbi:multiple epidermal growth factor-like domains protein 10 [Haliotis rufescens]|uniref:multiple epidermal growth factor-like domains protein 10 n=1 Tax=Haliotis rufescens TaxID=6454 RepID=UPI00201EFE9F|nr:multiple epidermal growth factor-like domains protein 10 [Haliotis rufescens]
MCFPQNEQIMTSLVILCFASVVRLIGATPCKDGQHCAVCDETGDCSSTCHPGYFNKRCTSTCNSGCRYKACELLKGSGIAACIHGCNPGLQGTSCSIPCEHQRQCTKCKGGCYGDYCQIGSVCVSGCVDSYYGLDCKNCSEQCKSCNRSTGMCNQCHSPYTGPICEMRCENCKGTCKAGCEGGCNPGFHGHWCEKVCSENCRAGLDATFVLECDRNVSNTCILDCDKKTGHCIHGCNPGFYGHWCEKVCSENCLPDPDGTSSSACDRNVSTNCTPECDKTTGYCIHGCNTGWHGTNCSSRCNSKCANLSCNDSGACVDGCAPGYAGTDCTCYENCFDLVCYSENGTCAKGCDKGYYGAFCNHSCEICIDGICDKEFGTCIKGCNITDHGCKSTCSSDCPIDICRNQSTCGQNAESLLLIIIGTSAACLVCLVGIIVAIYIGYYERTKREETDDEEVESPVEQQEARDYEFIDVDADKKNETGPASASEDKNNVLNTSEQEDDFIATPCKDGQHCAVCDETGDCSSTCHPGYFNKRCTSTCNSGCRYKACELLKGSGIAACIHGCNPGLQGTSCSIPCEHQRQCTECQGGCHGNYCQIGSVCVSGCVDSYYGLDCKNCSQQCKSCNRSTGMCNQCHSPYTGPNCEMPCENCKGTCKAGCEGGCNPGFYGHWCEKVCSENCRAGLDATFVLECDRNVSNTCILDCDKKTGHCIHGCNPGFYGHWCEKVCSENCLPDPDGTSSSACDRNVSTNCTPECDKTTGYCIHGCNTGWHGTNCSSRCNSKCANLACNDSGACVDGCAPGYAGTDCSCYESCIDHECHSENGTCVKGCGNGYYERKLENETENLCQRLE